MEVSEINKQQQNDDRRRPLNGRCCCIATKVWKKYIYPPGDKPPPAYIEKHCGRADVPAVIICGGPVFFVAQCYRRHNDAGCYVPGICHSVYQEVKSTNALEALKQYTAASSTVIRDGEEKIIATTELVPGDILLLHEGEVVPADATIISANDLTVNESVITGESFAVEKHPGDTGLLYQGSTVNSGACMAQVSYAYGPEKKDNKPFQPQGAACQRLTRANHHGRTTGII